jgi:hypothetical protein
MVMFGHCSEGGIERWFEPQCLGNARLHPKSPALAEAVLARINGQEYRDSMGCRRRVHWAAVSCSVNMSPPVTVSIRTGVASCKSRTHRMPISATIPMTVWHAPGFRSAINSDDTFIGSGCHYQNSVHVRLARSTRSRLALCRRRAIEVST